MECYFGTYNLPEDNHLDKSAVVLFHIPEVGIRFKAPFNAVNIDHSAYASLLALLEFIDSNQKYFKSHTYQIYGSNLKVVNQINQLQQSPDELKPLLEKALDYRKKYRFSLKWVPDTDNPALESSE